MPYQASTADHRVALVRWVASITTMHPASVTTIARPVAARLNPGEAPARRGMALSGAAA